MNIWTRKSIELANSPKYLDRLQEVYRVILNQPRDVDSEVIQRIGNFLRSDKKKDLINLLLHLDKFPIKDPFVAYLKRQKEAVDNNPGTVNRLFKALKDLGVDGIIEGVSQPKEFNRQMGATFTNWMHQAGYSVLNANKFQDSRKGIVILGGSGKILKNFSNDILGCRLIKEPDLVAKVNDIYVVGEAKFLTEFGGHQDRQLEDALSLVKGKAGSAVRIAILDGVVWIEKKTGMNRLVREVNKPVFSVLLLSEFLKSL